jgi:hypothetical protein
MPSIEKRLNKSAIIKGAAWGTAAQCGASGCGITPLNHGAFKLAMPAIEIDEINNANETDIQFANVSAIDFNLDFNYQWDGLENRLLAGLMGTAGAPVQQGATTAYLHTLVMNDSASGIYWTYACDKNDKVHVVPSAKVTKGAFSFNNGLIKSTFGLRGNNVTDADAVVTALTSVTYPAIHNRAKASQAVFRLNAQGGSDFAGGDVIYPKNFSIEIERSFDSEHAAGSAYIIEPRENSKPKVKVVMEFPRMDTTNEAYFANWTAGTEKKADLTITGAVISGAYSYYIKFQFPRLIIEDVEFPDAGLISAKATFRAVVADSAPTGMTGLTKPVTITLMNTRTADLLA